MLSICDRALDSRDKKREEKLSKGESPENETLGELTSHFDPPQCREGDRTTTLSWLVVGTDVARRRRLKRYPLQVRHKQDWGRGFILLLHQTAVLPESDAGSDVAKPASSFIIQNCQTSCSMWCPMYRARC